MSQIQKINRIKDKIISILQGKSPVILAIDGRCASGKSTLAKVLSEEFLCPVVHMDDFFLRPEQRTFKRLEEPGGNIDYERFLEEVMIPLQKLTGNLKEPAEISYRPYDCHSQSFKEAIKIKKSNLIIVEGSYSCHPKLWKYYDYHIYLDISQEEQMNRIRIRNGEEAAKIFREKWIPMEERYFTHFQIKQKCDMILEEKS